MGTLPSPSLTTRTCGTRSRRGGGWNWVGVVSGFSDRFPLAGREAREGEELVARFLQAVGDGAAFEPPFADERLAPGFDLRLRLGVDHIFVVVRDFLVQPLGRMGEEIAMLVHRATLDRHVGPQRRQRLFEA